MRCVYVQWTDGTESQILAVFCAEQGQEIYPNQGQVASDDQRYKDYYESMPEIVQQWMIIPGA